MVIETQSPGSSRGGVAGLVACILAFAVLMGARSAFEEPWIKIALAGCGGAFLGVALLLARKHWSRRK